METSRNNEIVKQPKIMATKKTLGQARIAVWSTPRSVSTAFARSMSARGDTEVFWEPYFACKNFGPDCEDDRAREIEELPDSMKDAMSGYLLKMEEMMNDKYTYSYVNSLMKADYPGAKVLFVKGMVEGIMKDYKVVNQNYKHTFLIRHPRKAYRSMVRSWSTVAEPQLAEMIVVKRYRDIFHELEQFYRHVEVEFDQGSPPIIDADDLINNAATILPKYCEAVGIDFTPKMLNWESVDTNLVNWHCTDVGPIAHEELRKSVIFSNAMKGEGFGMAPDLKKQEEMSMSAVVEELIFHALPMYEKLYALRIQP